jgi:hypothetical protein
VRDANGSIGVGWFGEVVRIDTQSCASFHCMKLRCTLGYRRADPFGSGDGLCAMWMGYSALGGLAAWVNHFFIEFGWKLLVAQLEQCVFFRRFAKMERTEVHRPFTATFY